MVAKVNVWFAWIRNTFQVIPPLTSILFQRYIMNEIVNKFVLPGQKSMKTKKEYEKNFKQEIPDIFMKTNQNNSQKI